LLLKIWKIHSRVGYQPAQEECIRRLASSEGLALNRQ
jgi:hypothetical protein